MKRYPLIFTFFIVLFSLSFMDIVINDRDFSELENRNLSKKPIFTIESLFKGTYLEKYEKYINDQFLYRDNFITIKSRFEYIQGKTENNGILFGSNNRLFEKITQIDEERVNLNIEAINAFAKNKNIPISFLLAPNSSEIYKEDMPYGSYIVNQEEGIENIYEKIKYTNNISILETLKNNKNEYIYYYTDHHWTSYGAYLAYEKLCKTLNLQEVDLNLLEKNEVNNFYGTYFSKAKNFNAKEDILTYYTFDNIEMEIDNNIYYSLYDLDKRLQRDKYSLFLNGNNSLTTIKNKDLDNNKKILVIKDSYANSLIPFLTKNYEEIHVIDLRSFSKSVNEYIENNDFNDILILYNYNTFIRDTSLVKIKY